MDHREWFIRAIIKLVMERHPKDCIFEDDAETKILNVALASDLSTSQNLVDVLSAAFDAHEIYCPHQGIDRRQ